MLIRGEHGSRIAVLVDLKVQISEILLLSCAKIVSKFPQYSTKIQTKLEAGPWFSVPSHFSELDANQSIYGYYT